MFQRTLAWIGLPSIAALAFLTVGAAKADAQGTDSQSNAAYRQPSAVDAAGRLLTASGVPNDNGQLRWPLGLAILAAPEADGLCEQIEVLIVLEATQSANGSVSPTVADQTRRAVGKLRSLLLKDKNERQAMALAVYEESERFLNRLDRAERLFRAGIAAPGGQ
jgi:hypothetical protein